MATKAVMPFTVMAMAGLSAFDTLQRMVHCNNQDRVGQEVRTISRGLLVRIQIASVDATRITAAVNSGEGGSTLRCRTREGIRDPGQGDDVAGVQRGKHEQHSEVAGNDGGSRCRSRCSEDEGRDGDG